MSPAARHIVICFHDFNRGGTERIAIAMAKHWAERARRVTILCGSEGSSEGASLRDTVDPRVEVVALDPRLPRSPISRLFLGRAMAPAVARLAPDAVFLPGNFHLVVAPAIASLPHAPAVVAKVSNPPVPGGLLGYPVRALFRRFQSSLDAVATMNTGLERELRELLPDLSVTTLWDPVFVQGDTEAPRVPAPDGALRVLWAGRFEPQKDVGLALRTMAELVKITPARLTMLGDGAELEAARRLVRAMKLEEVVDLRGFVPAIDPFMPQSDVMFISSRFEGGPAVAVEALAHGVPVVSTDCSHFLRDVMTKHSAGTIVHGRSPLALAQALADVGRRPAPPREFCRALAQRFAPDSCAQAYLDWIDATVAKRRVAAL